MRGCSSVALAPPLAQHSGARLCCVPEDISAGHAQLRNAEARRQRQGPVHCPQLASRQPGRGQTGFSQAAAQHCTAQQALHGDLEIATLVGLASTSFCFFLGGSVSSGGRTLGVPTMDPLPRGDAVARVLVRLVVLCVVLVVCAARGAPVGGTTATSEQPASWLWCDAAGLRGLHVTGGSTSNPTNTFVYFRTTFSSPQPALDGSLSPVLRVAAVRTQP